MSDSQSVYQARLHWIIFSGPVLLAAAAMILGITMPVMKGFSLIFILFACIWGGMMWVNYLFSTLIIERKRVVFCTGILIRKTTDIPYAKIESVDIRMSILGSIFRYGTLMITGTGGTRHVINFVDQPLTARRHIEQFLAVEIM